MTVRELKQAIANLPDDGEVYVQRIEDFYFENNHWTTKPMEGEMYHKLLKWNQDIDSGKFLDEEEYPEIIPEKHLIRATYDQLEASKEQYIDTHCCINYDGKNLYITSHY